MRLLLIILACAFCGGCVSRVSNKNVEPWIVLSPQVDIPREELRAIANAAAKTHNCVVFTISKDKDGKVAVCLAESKSSLGGSIVFYKKTDEGWVEDTNVFSMWHAWIKKRPFVSRKNW